MMKQQNVVLNFSPALIAKSISSYTFAAILLSLASLAPGVKIYGARLPVAAPARVGMSARHLRGIDRVVREAIARNELPGAVVLVGRKGRIVWRRAYGARALAPQREAMTVDTIFDLASLTKVVATTTSMMILIERGRLRLSDSMTLYLPELKGEGRDRITIEELLTHVSGYPPDFDLSRKWDGTDEMLRQLTAERLANPPGARFVYSDIGMIAIGEIIKRVSGQSLDEFARSNIFQPLGMRETSFNPNARLLRARIAPTETRGGQMNYLGGKSDGGETSAHWLRGEVHDPTAARLGGVAGHAGLFSTADDLAVFCQMLLNEGLYRSARILSPLGVAAMTRARAVGNDASARAIGWDLATAFSSNRGDLYPLGSYGHTGFTGTSIWIDPASDSFVIFLSNRVHPDGKGNVTPLRGRIASIVAASITRVPRARVREEEIDFAAQLLPSLARFRAQTPGANTETAQGQTPVDAEVLTGIDVLERENFATLANMRIGLLTNHTGVDRKGATTIDLLHHAPNVKLTALFSPEHGIRGLADEKVADAVDERTGLPIYSLYGESRRPKPEQLRDLDAIVFDVQDVGARFYTYISTLGYVMEEAAKAHLPVYVLDRPNPLGGLEIEGPLADPDQLSFTAYHTIPVRHGLTLGELALLYNAERNLGCDVRVVKMQRWQRSMWYDATNLTWINPSPNMRSLTEAALYPGIGLLETTNVSVGRGTDTPFELIGAPWIDPQALAAYLNDRHLAGVRFVAARFTPRASVFKGEACGGVNVLITNRANFKPVHTGLEIAVALQRLYPKQWTIDRYARLLVSAETLRRLQRGEDAATIERAWATQLDAYRRRRTNYLLYQ